MEKELKNLFITTSGFENDTPVEIDIRKD